MNSTRIILLLTISSAVLSCQTKTGNKNEQNQSAQSSQNETAAQNISMPEISIYEAALSGNIEVITSYISTGTDTDSANNDGHTPLMLAAFNGHSKIVELLLKNDADVHNTDSQNLTPLHFAASGPHPETVELLLANGADINAIDGIEEFTPLMYAAAEGNIEVVKILLKHNANVSLKDTDGDSAETFARQNNHKEIADILQNAGK